MVVGMELHARFRGKRAYSSKPTKRERMRFESSLSGIGVNTEQVLIGIRKIAILRYTSFRAYPVDTQDPYI